jgi:hypothetical protein
LPVVRLEHLAHAALAEPAANLVAAADQLAGAKQIAERATQRF